MKAAPGGGAPLVSLAALVAWLCFPTSTYASDYGDLSVVNPFLPPAAIDRLYTAVPSTPKELRSFLPLIYKIEYSFQKTDDCPLDSSVVCSNPARERPYFRATRKITLRLPDIDGIVAQALTSASYSGCSWMTVKNPRLLEASDKSLRYIAEIEGTKRACGNYPWPFKGEWKTDIASASGNVQASVNLENRPPAPNTTSDFGEFRFDVPVPSVNISRSDVIGINTNSVVGQLVGALLEGVKFVVDVGTFRTIDLGLGATLDFMNKTAPALNYVYAEGQAERMVRSVPEFYTKVEQLGITRLYFLDADRTKFGQPVDQWRTLEIVQFAAVPGPLMGLYYFSKDQEIRFFEDLGKGPEEHVVVKGDTLWKLSNERYGVGNSWYVIAHHNRLKGERLSLGQKLVLPRLWEVAAYEGQMVKPGDTLSNLEKRLGIPLAKPVGSRSISRIYPYQIVTPRP